MVEKTIALTITLLTVRQLVLQNQKYELKIKKLKPEIKNLKRSE